MLAQPPPRVFSDSNINIGLGEKKKKEEEIVKQIINRHRGRDWGIGRTEYWGLDE